MKRLTQDAIFASTPASTDLARKSIHGGMAALTSQGLQFLLSVAGVSVLARLLTPDDYGVLAMVTVLVGFAQMFTDAGLSMATVQQEHVSHEQISTLFWLNLLISAVLALGVLAGAPLVARVYARPELTGVTAALSLPLLLSGLVIQHQALLRRCLWFGTLATITIAAQVVTLGVTILLACCGARYWALVGGRIVYALVGTLLTFYFCPWFPGRMQRRTGVRHMLRFGGHLSGFNIIDYFACNADSFLIGKFYGASALGLYARAYQLFMLPVTQIRQPITAVAMPVLSSLQNQPERYVKYYQRMSDLLVSLMIPLAVYCMIEAEFLIRTILGSQWLGAVPVFRILAIAGLIQIMPGLAGLVMLSLGYSRRFFLWGVLGASLVVASFVIGLPFGIVGVATAYTTVLGLLLVPTLFYCYHGSPVTVGQTMKTLVLPCLISLAAGVSMLVARRLMNGDSIRTHGVLLGLYAGIVLGALYARRPFREILSLLVRDVARGARTPGATLKE